MKKLLLFLSLVLSIIACDKVDCPNEDGCVEPVNLCINSLGVDTCQGNCTNAIGLDTCILTGLITEHHSDSNIYQKILIEEYTGFKCTNCPDGARKIADLLTIYGDTLVPVSIHSGTFAEPGESGGHSYVTDFRTVAGDDYNTTFLEPGSPYPSAVINRTRFNSLYVQKKENWQTIINSEISNSTSTVPVLKVHTFYSEESHSLYCEASILFNESSSTNYGIVFLLIEDNIIDVQLDGGTFVEDYDHHHVLREALSNPFGDPVNATSVSIGEEITVGSDYLELDAFWKANDCEVVAVLVDLSSSEVKQAQSVHIF